MTAELVHSIADAHREAVTPAIAWAVAAGAGLRHRDRQPGVEIEFLAERSLFRRVGIVFREGNRGRAAIEPLQRVRAGRRFLLQRDLLRLADEGRAKAGAGKSDDEGKSGAERKRTSWKAARHYRFFLKLFCDRGRGDDSARRGRCHPLRIKKNFMYEADGVREITVLSELISCSATE